MSNFTKAMEHITNRDKRIAELEAENKELRTLHGDGADDETIAKVIAQRDRIAGLEKDRVIYRKHADVQQARIAELEAALSQSCDEERARCRAEGGYPCELAAQLAEAQKDADSWRNYQETKKRAEAERRYSYFPEEDE